MPNLQVLDLSRNQISEVSPIRTLKKLKKLSLSANNISSIIPLIDLSTLQVLNLNDNQLKILPDLKTMKSLKSLNVSDNQISDIENFDVLKKLGLVMEGNVIGNPTRKATLELEYFPDYASKIEIRDQCTAKAKALQKHFSGSIESANCEEAPLCDSGPCHLSEPIILTFKKAENVSFQTKTFTSQSENTSLEKLCNEWVKARQAHYGEKFILGSCSNQDDQMFYEKEEKMVTGRAYYYISD